MENLVKFAEESIGAFLVGRRLFHSQTDLAEKIVIDKSAQMISSVIAMILSVVSLFVLAILFALWVGYSVGAYYNDVRLTFAVPAILIIGLIALLYFRRTTIFAGLASRFMK